VAKHAFTATKATQLSLEKGDLITITMRLDNGWWKGKLINGQMGWLPGTYVTLL
jgi:hypothetical protein